jgi:RNA polymerase-binding transcription factor DksA
MLEEQRREHAIWLEKVQVEREKKAAERAKLMEKGVIPPAGEPVKVDGYIIRPTSDFDIEFLTTQLTELLDNRNRLLNRAQRLEAEAIELMQSADRDTRFDEEGGGGDSSAIEREQDIALSIESRETVQKIDDAISRMASGVYGYSVVSQKPILRERLEAIPWATELTHERAGMPLGW